MKKNLFILFLIVSFVANAQQKRIKIVHADNSTIDEDKYPGATILLGNVYIEHEGIAMRSKKAIHYKNDNILKAFGDVVLNQGDTIIQTSSYVQYNGNTKKARSWGNVVLKDELITLTTDTLDFDRLNQILYYRSGATIKDDENTLESKEGNYYLETTKFQALSDVVLTNPEYVLESNHLDYFTNNGHAFLHGPSTITGKDNRIYCEKGFYDTKNDISHFTKNAKIEYDDRTIKADSLYYDRTKGFASATEHVQMKDTVNNSVIKGNYGEFFQKLDSAYVIGRAVAITEIDKDSMYVHGDTLLITGRPENRIIRAYHHVKFFKSDLSGKCDSIHSNQQTGLIQMFKNPVLWAQGSQITGDTIHLISNTKTEKLDSLKVLQNAFIVQKDSAGFNQIKGRDLLGKFIDNNLENVNIVGNAESIFFVRNDTDNSLIGINKTKCSWINFVLKDNKMQSAKYHVDPEGGTYPLSEFPENVRIFRGFVWRENEKPLTKDDIFNVDTEIPLEIKENSLLKNQKVVNKNLQKPSGKVNIKGNRQKKLKKTINSKEKLIKKDN